MLIQFQHLALNLIKLLVQFLYKPHLLKYLNTDLLKFLVKLVACSRMAIRRLQRLLDLLDKMIHGAGTMLSMDGPRQWSQPSSSVQPCEKRDRGSW